MPATSLLDRIAVAPAAATPADLTWTGHLLRRAGFGGPPDEIAAFAKLGVEGAIDRLVNFEQVEEMADPSASIPNFDPNAIGSLQTLWLVRMASSPRPLEERMTLFWHNHFATSVRKVNNPLAMWNQNSLFRRHALGNFRELTQAVAKDPAMMQFLDTQTSIKSRPNENFSRELLELFTVGIGNYTEQDIKESARAFTGWQIRDQQYYFNRAQFDTTSKTYMGKTGNFTGEEIIDIAVSQPATARFITTKLYSHFVDDNPRRETIDALAKVFIDNNTDIRPVVAAILRSPEFTSAYHAKIKSPIDFVVGMSRSLGLPVSEFPQLNGVLRSLGQELFAPPNVAGWPDGPQWLSASTLLARSNFANTIVTGRDRNRQTWIDPNALLDVGTTADPKAVVDAMLGLLIEGDVTADARAELLTYFQNGSQRPGRKGLDGKLRGLMHVIMASPAYQFK